MQKIPKVQANTKIVTLLFAAIASSPVLAFADTCTSTTVIDAHAYKAEMSTNQVTFLAIDVKTGGCYVINEQGLNERHTPFSSFKIPNTLIALETGAAKSIDEKIEWNPVKRPAKDFWPDTWKQDQTLATAFVHSAAWYYQDISRRIPPADYHAWLKRFSYGNRNFTSGNDAFWLDGELKISTREQVRFLHCLLESKCGVKAATLNAFESIARQKLTETKFLFAKTGAGPIDPSNNQGAFEGWYVGYIKEGEDPLVVFAIYVESENFSSIKDFRRAFSLKLLADLGYWEK